MAGKNHLAALLLKAKDEAYSKGVLDGMMMGHNLDVICMHHLEDYGKKRVQRWNDYLNELYKELVDPLDPAYTSDKILKALKQIRGEDFEPGYVDPPKGE